MPVNKIIYYKKKKTKKLTQNFMKLALATKRQRLKLKHNYFQLNDSKNVPLKKFFKLERTWFFVFLFQN